MNLAGVLPVDSLARPAHPRAVGGRQRLLHGLSFSAASYPCPPLPAGGLELAAAPTEQVVGDPPDRCFSYGLTRRWPSGTSRGGRHGSSLGYFAAAFVIDGLFRGASFCKYVCPIGQFNFVQSLASPLEVKVRDPAVCASCHTKDCIRGRDGIPGCELNLFLPRKAGNMDCTACLDCVHACPYQNVGLIAGFPTAELWHDRQRSGVGRFGRRHDIAALIVVLVFGAFANAAGMVVPIAEGQRRLASLVGVHSALLATTAFYVLAVVGVPLLAVGGAAALSRRWGRRRSRHPGGGDALRLRPGAARARHVAGALPFSFSDELPNRRARRAVPRGRPRADVAGHA